MEPPCVLPSAPLPPVTVATDSARTEPVARTLLDNGVLVLSEAIPGVRSVAIGVWVRQGGAHESDSDTGSSHLLEHMVFKGTHKRSAAEIAAALENLGGSLDAYTSREHTSYQARLLDEHLPTGLDVLADLALNPLLRAADLELEREVVLEEIAQVEDTPDDLVFELHGSRLWGAHPYGRSILGTNESVASMSADTLRGLHETRYTGANLIVAAAGNVHHDGFVERVFDLFGAVPRGERARPVAHPVRTERGFESVRRPSAQTHIVFGKNVPGHAHPDRYALILLCAALGGGMSSRLFQKIREELALCYSVYSYQSFYEAAGINGVYVGTRPATAAKAIDAVRTELQRLADGSLAAEELQQTKDQVKGQLTLSLESTGSRLYRLASSALHDEPFCGLDELLGRFDAVTPEDVRRVAGSYYAPSEHFALGLGPQAL